MKVTGEGFSYWLNSVKLKNFDEFERKIKNIEVEINIDKLNVRATTK